MTEVAVRLDKQGQFLSATPQFYAWTGLKAAALHKKPWDEIFLELQTSAHDLSPPLASASFARSQLLDGNGDPEGTIIIVRCSTNGPQDATSQLLDTEDKMRAILDYVPAIISLKDLSGKFMLVNSLFQEIYGVQDPAANQLTVFDIHPADRAKQALDFDRQVIETGKSNQREILVDTADGRRYYVVNKFPVVNAKGEIFAIGSIGTDVTDRKRIQEELTHRASHDSLTGLANRTVLESRLTELGTDDRTKHTSHTLCFLDIDQFKVVNDTCGHAAGDRLLIQFARLLESIVGQNALVVRFGGDEFCLLFESMDVERAAAFTETARNSHGEHALSS